VAVNHNRIDATRVSGIPGVESKATLEKRVKTELEQEELRLLQEAKTAEDEVAKSRAALADSMRDEAESHA